MPFVIYGVTTNTSISALFVSGIVPGLIMGVGLVVAWRWVLRDLDLPQGTPLPMKERLRATLKAFWAMLMPLIIIGGMKTGVFTPTEAAVVAAFYALVVALFVHREMKFIEVYGVLVRASKTTAIVMFLCAGAQVASYMITLADLPNVLTGWLGPLVESPKLVMMVVLIVIGTALETKTVDGQENPFNTILSSKFYEVQKYMTVTNHVYSPWIVTVSKKWWDQLSKDEQKVLMEAAKVSRDFERKDTREEAARAMGDLKAKGMLINELSPAESTRMRDKLTKVYALIAADVGMDLWNETQAELMKIRAKK